MKRSIVVDSKEAGRVILSFAQMKVYKCSNHRVYDVAFCIGFDRLDYYDPQMDKWIDLGERAYVEYMKFLNQLIGG